MPYIIQIMFLPYPPICNRHIDIATNAYNPRYVKVAIPNDSQDLRFFIRFTFSL